MFVSASFLLSSELILWYVIQYGCGVVLILVNQYVHEKSPEIIFYKNPSFIAAHFLKILIND